jgi:hypothetical protein
MEEGEPEPEARNVGGMLHHGRQACRKKTIALFRIMPIDSVK